MENEMANSRLALATVGIELQKLVLKKVKIMNDDNKPIFDRFIEWLRKQGQLNNESFKESGI